MKVSCIHSTFLTFLIIVITACGYNNDAFVKGEYENYQEEDFYIVQGHVYMVRSYFSFVYLERSWDIFYHYQVDSVTVINDCMKETTLRGLKKGDKIQLLVHKDNAKVNFYNGRW